MEIYRGGHFKEILAVRLDFGEDVLASVEAAAREYQCHTGVVLSGIGTLDQVRLHHITHTGFPPIDEFVTYEGPFELLSIQGIIADYVPHLHTCVSRKDETFMGHLEPGCRVLYLAEIVIGVLDGMRLQRVQNPETSVKQLTAG